MTISEKYWITISPWFFFDRICDEIDTDGDMDLFVGSRSVPGAYGWSPDQFLLENDGHGHFKDVTLDRTAGLKNNCRAV